MPILFIMLSNVVTGLKLGTIALEFTTLTKVAVIGLGHIHTHLYLEVVFNNCRNNHW